IDPEHGSDCVTPRRSQGAGLRNRPVTELDKRSAGLCLGLCRPARTPEVKVFIEGLGQPDRGVFDPGSDVVWGHPRRYLADQPVTNLKHGQEDLGIDARIRGPKVYVLGVISQGHAAVQEVLADIETCGIRAPDELSVGDERGRSVCLSDGRWPGIQRRSKGSPCAGSDERHGQVLQSGPMGDRMYKTLHVDRSGDGTGAASAGANQLLLREVSVQLQGGSCSPESIAGRWKNRRGRVVSTAGSRPGAKGGGEQDQQASPAEELHRGTGLFMRHGDLALEHEAVSASWWRSRSVAMDSGSPGLV